MITTGEKMINLIKNSALISSYLTPVLVGVGGIYLITRWWLWMAVGVVLLIVAAGILGRILMEYIKDYFR